MYMFEGEYRRKPEQCLSGASILTERNELLQHVRQQRQKREECRKRTKCTILIQAFVRGYLTRKRVRHEERVSFDVILQGTDLRQNADENILSLLIKKLLFFYNGDVDDGRLVSVSQIILTLQSRVIKLLESPNNQWFWLIQRLLNLNLGQILALVKSRGQDSIAVSLRMLEVFTSLKILGNILSHEKAKTVQGRIYTYLVGKNYFKSLKYLLDEKTPPLLCESVDPPTPLVACLFDLLIRPLHLVDVVTPHDFRDVFSQKLTEAMKLFVIPAIADLQFFPYYQMLEFLREWKNSNETSKNENPNMFSTSMLFTILSLEKKHFWLQLHPTVGELTCYLQVLATLTANTSKLSIDSTSQEEDEDELSDFEMEEGEEVELSLKEEMETLEACVVLLNDPNKVNNLLTLVDETEEPMILQALCEVCYNLLISNKLAVYKYRLLYLLAFKPSFLRHLWFAIQRVSQTSVFGSSTPLINFISRGIPLSSDDSERLILLLAVFCSLFSLLIAILHDSEFYGDENGSGQTMPFTLQQLVNITRQLKDISLGLVDLAFPDSIPAMKESIRGIEHSISTQQTHLWSNLFKVVVNLVRQLHARDSRRPFCPEDHWISKQVQIIYQPSELPFRKRRLRGYRPFQGIRALSREELEDGGPPLTTKEVRTAILLMELPFLVPFQERVMVFQTIVLKDKMEHQGEATRFLMGPSIEVSIRRNYIYEDAFEKLSIDKEPELRLKMRVQLVNVAGLEEAGLDGGGLFREFLSELLKTAFDPNRGFFRLTKDNLLYPNPHVHLILDDFPRHYYFIGRMLGKALYENLLVELPFAEFFLSKLVGRHSDVDIHHLASLDPLMYRNLLFLKSYEGDVLDLGLDFIIMNEELGETRIEELKPGGKSIPVTSANRIEYIHLMADYKLNKQIRTQCIAFKQGLTNVIPLEWIQMFNNKELQVLISGAEIPVDVDDLKQYTKYSGGYTDDHPTIKIFWKVVRNFSDTQKRQLLKFVTSCSRPPLLGFKELDPPFCIQNAGTVDRLPTASTCMNLLKLPEFPDEKLMTDKLVYAIQSGAGFELI
ncbi:hypothetical protein RUM44_005560 [Polyplax serrata]|uniref:HECT-type E3 ubiquitin transferase n=1 Tax=Polyplax serrata TaxID=468196 RepID=A0ABR1ADQ4_POLSC